jgi:hypothetical protein
MEGKPAPTEVTAFGGGNLTASLEMSGAGDEAPLEDPAEDGGFSRAGPQSTYADSVYDDAYSERPSTAASISVDFDNEEGVGGSRRQSESNMLRSASATAFNPLNADGSINDPGTPTNSDVSRPETVSSNAASAMSSLGGVHDVTHLSPVSAASMAGGGDMMAFYASASKEDDDDDDDNDDEEESRRKENELESRRRRSDLENYSNHEGVAGVSVSSPSRAAGTGIRAIKALQAEEALASGGGTLSLPVTTTTTKDVPSTFFVDSDNSWVDRAFCRRVLVVDPEIDKDQEREKD